MLLMKVLNSLDFTDILILLVVNVFLIVRSASIAKPLRLFISFSVTNLVPKNSQSFQDVLHIVQFFQHLLLDYGFSKYLEVFHLNVQSH